jgi:hypothetical protein
MRRLWGMMWDWGNELWICETNGEMGRIALLMNDRIVHEVVGMVNKTRGSWSSEVIPAALMRDIVLSVEDKAINGEYIDEMHCSSKAEFEYRQHSQSSSEAYHR